MATVQQMKPAQKNGTWNQMFPTEQSTEQQSLLFVKKLLAVAISNIAYLRALFPETAFGDRCLEDLNLKILKEDGNCPGASQVISWIKACFDALDKKFLRMMIIGIYVDPDDPETVIESYTFKFSYADNGSVDIYRNEKKLSSAYSSTELKKSTIRLLHTIVILAQSLQSLPENVMMTMKLLYYDEVTPSDYEPPGFIPSKSDGFNFDGETDNIKVGDVATAFHTIKLRVKTDAKLFAALKDDEEQSGNAEAEQKETNTEEINHMSCESDSPVDVEENSTYGRDASVPEPCEADEAPNDTPMKPATDDQAVDNNGTQVSNITEDENAVRCACGCNEDDGVMIRCDICKFWQHGVCFQIFVEDEAPLRHICNVCADSQHEEKQPTDPTLAGLNEVAIEATCLWRRTLFASKSLKRVSGALLAKSFSIELPVANGLYRRLDNEGFIKTIKKGKRFGANVIPENVDLGIEKYFQNRQKDSAPVVEETVNKNDETRTKSSEKMDDEISQIIARADNLDVSGKWKTQKDIGGEKKKRNKGRKRVKSIVDENEFDLSGSQDQSQTDGIRGHKRRCKTSQVENAIPV